MIMRFSKAVVATLICTSFAFSTGCAVSEGYETGKRDICKENGKRLKSVDKNRKGEHRETCRDGSVYVLRDGKWVKTK